MMTDANEGEEIVAKTGAVDIQVDTENHVYESSIKPLFKNRIVKSAYADPEELLANPDNFRIHPIEQREVLEGLLRDIGWVGSTIVNLTTNRVIDGHLRVSIALSNNEKRIPVDYVELSEEEEKLILAFYDHVTQLAAIDDAKYRELLLDIDRIAPELDYTVEAELARLAEQYKIYDEHDAALMFAEFDADNEYDDRVFEQFVTFKFGDYSAQVTQEVYDSFVSAYRSVRRESDEELNTLDDVLKAWLNL